MVKTGQAWSGAVVTLDTTGALAAASVGPVGALYVDGTATADSVTVTGANPYKWTVTLPALTAGQSVSMYVTATVGGVATAAVVAEEIADTSRLSDVKTDTAAILLDTGTDGVVLANDAITAAKVAANAIGASELAADAIAEIADAVLDEVYTAHTTAYTLGAFLNATDPTTVTVTSSNDAGELTLYRGVTFAATVSGLTISASWTKIAFTVKTDLDLADTASTIQIVESNPGVGTDGLLYLNGAALASPITAADASLTVTQAAGTVAIALSDDATALLSRARSVHWDLKQWVSSATTLLTSGSADIELTPTRTV